MTHHIDSEALHRLVKLAIDNGSADSVEGAQALFDGYSLATELDRSAADDMVQQMMLLTTVALAVRVFMGGVTISGDLDQPQLPHLPLGPSLKDAIKQLGGRTVDVHGSGKPAIVIGGKVDRRETFAVLPLAAGWRGGIVPAHSDHDITGGPASPLAAMLAAALAVNEAFLHINGNAPIAGKQVIGLSLWQPQDRETWLTAKPDEPELTYLPSKLWLIGLGHLGQAYLWGLGLLPYARPSDLSLVLQDFDTITRSTQSTSILTAVDMVGIKKNTCNGCLG